MELETTYDSLAEFFGKSSDFRKEQAEISEMYQQMQKDEWMQERMEGEMVAGFNDLLSRERDERDDRVNTLLNMF